MSQWLSPIKSTFPLQQVYKLDSDWGLLYIEETKSSIRIRVIEYVSDIKTRCASKSSVCVHAMGKPGHYIGFDKPQFLACEDSYKARLICEDILIKKKTIKI